MTTREGQTKPAALGQEDERRGGVAKRDRRWQRTHETFVRAGFDVFGRLGLDGVSVDAIIAAAGVSKQTFYNHFVDREALLLELRLRSRQIFEDAVTAANDGEVDPARRLVRGLAVYARIALNDPLHAQFVLSALLRPAARERLLDRGVEHDLAEGLRAGRLRFSTVAGAVIFVSGTAQGLLGRILQGSDEMNVIVTCQEVLALLLRGFSCDPLEAELIAAQAVDQIIRQHGAAMCSETSNADTSARDAPGRQAPTDSA